MPYNCIIVVYRMEMLFWDSILIWVCGTGKETVAGYTHGRVHKYGCMRVYYAKQYKI